MHRFTAVIRRPGPVIWASILIAVSLFLALAPDSFLLPLGDDVLIPASFWAGVVFTVYYTFLARWWHNAMGRMLVGLDFAIVLLTLDSVLQSEFGVSLDSQQEIRLLVGILLLCSTIIISRILLLGRVQGWRPHWPWNIKGIPREDTRQ